MSTSKKKGLGRGLRALFGDQTKEAKKNVTKVSHSITSAEAAVLESLLEHFIVEYHNWGY